MLNGKWGEALGSAADRRFHLVLVVVAWVAATWGLWCVDRNVLGVAHTAYAYPATVALNALPVWAVALLLVAVTRRWLLPILLAGLLQALLYYASARKLAILGSPLALQDLYFVTTINRATLELFTMYVRSPWLLALMAVAGVLACWAGFALERPRMRKAGPMRVAVLVIGGGLLMSLYQSAWPWSALYTREHVRPSKFQNAPAVLHAGLFGSLVYRHLTTSTLQFHVDAQALDRTLETLAHPLQPEGVAAMPSVKPDVVVILSESFMDPRLLQGMADLPDAMPNVRRLIQAGRGGRMQVPTYGGGTVRTEFEVLTGMPVVAFPDAYFPYVDISWRRLPGLPGIFRAAGYQTSAVHGNAGAFWKRTGTFAAMGFERFLTEKAFAERKATRDGLWYSDKAMTDLVLEQLNVGDAPKFVMAISMENHGPYAQLTEVQDPARRNAEPVPSAATGKARLALQNYLYHQQNADHQFQRLLDALDARGRPYVVAFFGDHLPAMPQTYDALGFVDGQAADQQRVPWVLVTRGVEPQPLADVDIDAWQLPNQILQASGLPMPAYFQFTTQVGRGLRHSQDADERHALMQGIVAGANARASLRFQEYAHAR